MVFDGGGELKVASAPTGDSVLLVSLVCPRGGQMRQAGDTVTYAGAAHYHAYALLRNPMINPDFS